MTLTRKRRIAGALDIAMRYGQIEGDHHRCWVIDQMVRELTANDTGDGYEDWVHNYESPADFEGEYKWKTGIAP